MTGVTSSVPSVSVEEGATSPLTFSVDPTTATDKALTYSVDSEAIATYANGTVTGVSAGSTNITATSTNGKTKVVAVTVTEIGG